ncbi:MAG: hypothetical protein J2P21_16275 [Chloracidobacterium sp.]|nr:hypothetical protein [Chloracidobacterium sp.]
MNKKFIKNPQRGREEVVRKVLRRSVGKGKLEMVRGLLRLGQKAAVENLNSSLLDDFGEALLYFQNEDDIQDWLARNAK